MILLVHFEVIEHIFVHVVLDAGWELLRMRCGPKAKAIVLVLNFGRGESLSDFGIHLRSQFQFELGRGDHLGLRVFLYDGFAVRDDRMVPYGAISQAHLLRPRTVVYNRVSKGRDFGPDIVNNLIELLDCLLIDLYLK